MALKFSLLIAAAILFFSLAFTFLLRYNIRRNQKEELFFTAELISNQVLENDFYFAPENAPYYISVTIYSGDAILYTNDPFLPILPFAEKPKIYVAKDFYIDGDLNILYFTKKVGGTVIQVSLNMDNDYGTGLLRGLPFVILALAIPLLLVSFGAGFLITKKSIRPVLEMTKKAEKISAENLSERFEVSDSGDEFDTLAKTFNSLFEKLKSDFEREKQFTSDVSHELKTPLAVIQGHANLIRRWGKDDPVQLEKSIACLLDETKSMEKIVDNLLQLSRLESGRVKLNKTEVSVAAIFERLIEDTKAWAENVEAEIDAGEGSVLADSELLYEALTIIVSNSVKYCDKEKLKINLKFSSAVNGKIISITDNGSGISAEKLPHVFERFYRGDESHNRGKGGFGLGLSIVESIMKVHGGKATAQSDGISGTTITLEF